MDGGSSLTFAVGVVSEREDAGKAAKGEGERGCEEEEVFDETEG